MNQRSQRVDDTVELDELLDNLVLDWYSISERLRFLYHGEDLDNGNSHGFRILISSWMVIEAIQKYMKKHLCISLLSDSVE
jgi:hypothetical protein